MTDARRQETTIGPDPDSRPHILVVDDDKRLRALLQKYLRDNGFAVTTAADAEEARARVSGITFDLIVLDVMMPGENGLDFTHWLRRRNDVPILLLTARGERDDRIAGLEAGADDYLLKPFEPRELILRIESILRRIERPPEAARQVSLGRWRFDPDREELHNGEEAVRLTSTEATLLRILAQSPNEILSRETLCERGAISGNARSIDVQVTRLRRKIEDDPRVPRYLHTVRGEGYVLRPD